MKLSVLSVDVKFSNLQLDALSFFFSSNVSKVFRPCACVPWHVSDSARDVVVGRARRSCGWLFLSLTCRAKHMGGSSLLMWSSCVFICSWTWNFLLVSWRCLYSHRVRRHLLDGSVEFGLVGAWPRIGFDFFLILSNQRLFFKLKTHDKLRAFNSSLWNSICSWSRSVLGSLWCSLACSKHPCCALLSGSNKLRVVAIWGRIVASSPFNFLPVISCWGSNSPSGGWFLGLTVSGRISSWTRVDAFCWFV